MENKMIFGNKYTKIEFLIQDQEIFIKSILFEGKEFVYYEKGIKHSNVFLVGEIYPRKIFNRYTIGGEELKVLGYMQENFENRDELTIEEHNDIIYVKTTYILYKNSAVLQCKKEVKNMSSKEIVLECVSPLTLKGIMLDNTNAEIKEQMDKELDPTAVVSETKRTQKQTFPWLWKCHNTWCSEGRFERFDLNTEGILGIEKTMRCGRIIVAGNGTQTTNRYLPMGIFEKPEYGFLMFEILPVGSWSYEIAAGLGEDTNEWTLAVMGKTLNDNGWYKALKSDEVYETETVRVVGASDLDGIIEHSFAIRRNEKRKIEVEPCQNVIHNMFMQNVYASPSETVDEKYIPYVSELGADYYVVDAGWFDDMNTKAIGIWDESPISYPSGFQKTIDKVRAKGMKFGLWLELQGTGVFCSKEVLPEYCYFHIHGKRQVCNGRYHLNYAVKEVRDWADGIVKKVVDRYKPDYIKIDHNHTQLGTECNEGSFAEGLALHSRSYYEWFKNIQDKYPNIMFESCSSGGMYMDSNIAKLTSAFSISDQNGYTLYPSILCNLPLAILPEQMGVWTIPVNRFEYPQTYDEEIVFNVINSLYGVMHLCSKIDVLTEKQKMLIKEGIKYYKSLAKIKTKATAIMPCGFASIDDEILFTGLKYEGKLYISVYNISDKEVEVVQDFSKYNVGTAELMYPKAATNEYTLKDGVFRCMLKAKTARAFEME